MLPGARGLFAAAVATATAAAAGPITLPLLSFFMDPVRRAGRTVQPYPSPE